MKWTKRRESCRALFSSKRCVYPGSVFDPLSARIAEEVGYEIGAFAGSTASLTILGAPDLTVVTLTEFAAQAHRINRAFNLPILVDADHGYGNALNVIRTIEELETVGVAALTIEDTLLPSAYGGSSAVELISIEEGVGKMRAALSARIDPAMTIIARTSSLVLSGMAEALKRTKAYAAAGVDGVFLLGVTTREQLEEFAAAVRIPIVLGNAAPALRDLDYLGSSGVRICMQGHAPIRAAIRALYDAMATSQAGSAGHSTARLSFDELMQRLTRRADYSQWSKDFLGGDLAHRD